MPVMTDTPSIPFRSRLSTFPAFPTRAEKHRAPANTTVLLHVDSVMVLAGQFARVSGTLDYDPSRQTCHVGPTMDAVAERRVAKSGSMLDRDRFAIARDVGDRSLCVVTGRFQSCRTGRLTMLDSTGTFRSRRWGMPSMRHPIRPRMRTETPITLPTTPAAHG